MPNGDSGPYALSHVLREEFEALRGQRPNGRPTLDRLTDEFKRLGGGDAQELERRAAVYVAAHKLEPGIKALCLSGGGIRSASFSLGVLQGLAERGLLRQFDYLSTVSGGGYIGSWLSAWLHREGSDAVMDALQPARRPPDNEPRPIRHLREYSSYLTPKVGLLSADTWAAAAIILRNILLNWLILIPAIALPVVGLKLVAAVAHTGSRPDPSLAVLVAICTLILGSVALGYKLLRLYSGGELTDSHRAQRNFLLLSVTPAVFAGACFSWLTVAGVTPADPIVGLVVKGEASPWRSWAGMLIFALLVYLGASAVAAAGRRWFCSPTRSAHATPRRERCWDVTAWILAVLVFGTAIWVGRQIYDWLHNPVVLYRDWCVIQSVPCIADPKPQMGSLSIRVNREVLLVIFGMPWFLLSTLLAHTTYLLFRSYSPAGDVEREWLGRASGWHFISALLWLVLSSVVLVGPKLYYGVAVLGENAGRWLVAINAVSGVVTALVGKSGFTPARGSATDWKGISLNLGLALAGSIFAFTLLILLSAWSDGIILGFSEDSAGACFSTANVAAGCYQPRSWIALGVLVVILMLGASFFVNVNRFSLHAVYRNRLIRAYLGASRPDRTPDGFTGFDWNDNLRVASLWDDAAAKATRWRPFHVINMTLNLAATRNLAWQQRKAMSFTATPKYCGDADLGYRDTREYGDPAGGMTLGTAMAISGAAVSPNMGYHSSSAAAFLLTMFDVRLGWWLGNPGPAGGRVGIVERSFKRLVRPEIVPDPYVRDAPWFALRPLLSELFGLTNDDSPYVYLSDGGHFEDLGLYEMVRRRCRWIVVCDGAQDRNRAYEDLGNAVRKIWIDLGVRIKFDSSPLLQADNLTKPGDLPYYAVGTIEYISDLVDGKAPQPGYVLYIKPAVRGDESAADIIAYQRLNNDFPQQSTGDQWFDEPQIESYRALGYLMISRIIQAAAIDPGSPGNFESFFAALRDVDARTLAPHHPSPP